MLARIPYAWTTENDDLDEDAINVSIGGTSAQMISAGLSYAEPRANIGWFARVTMNGILEGGSEMGLDVPDALQRAEDLRNLMGYSRVVVLIEEFGMWRPEWGQLADWEGLS